MPTTGPYFNTTKYFCCHIESIIEDYNLHEKQAIMFLTAAFTQVSSPIPHNLNNMGLHLSLIVSNKCNFFLIFLNFINFIHKYTQISHLNKKSEEIEFK